MDAKNLEKAREVGNGLLADVLAQAQAGDSPEAVRELAYDLCLLPGAKKDDLDVVGQWALKVREMVQDMDSRRDDAREAAVDGVRRLEETWKLFRELEPKLVVNDEQLFRELKDRFGSPYGFGQYFRGGMGAEAIRDLLRDLDLAEESITLRDVIKTSKGQKQQRGIKRLKVATPSTDSEQGPEWMILTVLPVIPPDLRRCAAPTVAASATSDLQRPVPPCDQPEQPPELGGCSRPGAPEITSTTRSACCRKRSMPCSTTAAAAAAVTTAATGRWSLSDMLKGKQGRASGRTCSASASLLRPFGDRLQART